jgi:flagellar FliJ protein
MSHWAHSLIRLSNYEVETLQKRLSDITDRRTEAELRLAVIEAEAESEIARARSDPDAGLMLQAYLNGWSLRRVDAASDVALIDAEEQGAREALTGAFSELKKFEHVAEVARLDRIAAAARRESAVMDEQALRRRAS